LRERQEPEPRNVPACASGWNKDAFGTLRAALRLALNHPAPWPLVARSAREAGAWREEEGEDFGLWACAPSACVERQAWLFSSGTPTAYSKGGILRNAPLAATPGTPDYFTPRETGLIVNNAKRLKRGTRLRCSPPNRTPTRLGLRVQKSRWRGHVHLKRSAKAVIF